MIINNFEEKFNEITQIYLSTLDDISIQNTRAVIDKTILQKYYLLDIKRACSDMLRISNPYDKFLDYGNGVSPVAAIMSSFINQVYACDILKEDWNVRWWKKMSDKFGHQQYIISGDERLPHNDNYFDSICMYAVLEHIGSSEDEIYSKLPELSRVLKSGGYIFIYRTPQKYSIIEYFERLAGIPCHKVLMDPKKVELSFMQNGFSLVKYKKYGILPDFWPNGRLSDFQNKHAEKYHKVNEFIGSLPLINFLAHDLHYVFRKN